MTWIWCVQCQRAFPVGHYRICLGLHGPRIDVVHDVRDSGGVQGEERGLHCCAYPDCHGMALWDMINWHDLRDLDPTCYPEVPEMGHIYALQL
jgi:hypothetical protein